MTEPAGTQTLFVLGLFDSERAADAVLSHLAAQGMSQDAIKVINRPDLDTAEPAIPYPAFKAGASLGPLRPEPETLPGAELAEEALPNPQQELRQLLEQFDLDAEEATYYAGGVYEGGTLVVVRAPGDTEAAQLRQLLADAGATNFRP
ncbi:MAG: hypothetical protein RRC07_04600 [Anaerolineae bacterium]|nr:hypothetical protein [Anaerolineae bacterium]